jgi:hypothetical protein
MNLILQARQSLGVGVPPFQPISLARYSQALGEAGRYAAWLAAVRKELEQGQHAAAGAWCAVHLMCIACWLACMRAIAIWCAVEVWLKNGKVDWSTGCMETLCMVSCVAMNCLGDATARHLWRRGYMLRGRQH